MKDVFTECNDIQPLLTELRDVVSDEFSGERVLSFLYGSYAYGLQGIRSDLDLLVIAERNLQERGRRLVYRVLELHKKHDLTIDQEIPFHRKLAATWDDLEAAIAGQGFCSNGRRLTARPVVKTRAFLESEEIRLRLLLNAIAGRVLLVSGDAEYLSEIQHRARTNWVRILILLEDLDHFSLASFVDRLIGSGTRVGEWFLGFKPHPVIRSFLCNAFSEVLSTSVTQGRLNLDSGRYSVRDRGWLDDLLRGIHRG